MVKGNKPKAASDKPEHVNAEQVDVQSTKPELTPEEKKKMYTESVTRTIIATVLGIICGVIFYKIYPDPTMSFWLAVSVLILIITLTYYLQKRLVLPILKLDVRALDWKSWFGIEFLVLSYCLVTWTILLNTNIM
ncbi:MAG: hypothetical protein FWH46_06435 [Methanimicrococcus sp.]|nr:hypothetical protein [Methanimicrococcus sp.]